MKKDDGKLVEIIKEILIEEIEIEKRRNETLERILDKLKESGYFNHDK